MLYRSQYLKDADSVEKRKEKKSREEKEKKKQRRKQCQTCGKGMSSSRTSMKDKPCWFLEIMGGNCFEGNDVLHI